MKTTATFVSLLIGLGTILGFIAAVIWYSYQFTGRVSRLEEQVRSLEASSAATAAASAEATRRLAVAVNSKQQKCVELADEASTGQPNTGMGSTFGPEVTKSARIQMEKLGCGLVR